VRGWNGTLTLEQGRVVLSRGLRGALVRKRRDPAVVVPVERIGLVRFAPARGLGGYVQVVERDATPIERGYLDTIRDPRTVTFMARSGRWRRLAEEIAAQSGATLEVNPAQPYRSEIRNRTTK
jgi:hypothetical protein